MASALPKGSYAPLGGVLSRDCVTALSFEGFGGKPTQVNPGVCPVDGVCCLPSRLLLNGLGWSFLICATLE